MSSEVIPQLLKIASPVLVLSLLATAYPPGPVKPGYYKDDQGNYNIDYKVETDKGLISVKQHHHNLGALVKPVREDEPSLRLPPPVELEPAPLDAKYISPPLLPIKDKGELLDPLPVAPKYAPVRRKPLTSTDEVYQPPKYVPLPPKYVSVKPEFPDEEYCPPEEGVPSPVPKYESVRFVSDNSYSPPPAYNDYPDPLDRNVRAKAPFERNEVLSRVVGSTGDDFFEMPKEQKDRLYSMGLLYTKNLWG